MSPTAIWQVLQRIPPDLIPLVLETVSNALDSPDPARALKRAAAAAASERASEGLLKRLLGRARR